jgi:hypothetical protein
VVNPFRDLPPIELDGEARDLTAELAPLGELKEGRVIRIQVRGEGIEHVLVLTEDALAADSGAIVGGGPANAAFDYRIPADGGYFVFVQFAAGNESPENVTLAVGPGDAGFSPPARQIVQVIFEPGYLTDPGLFDPVDGTEADRQFLEDISPQVQAEIMATLTRIFADTPVEIRDEATPAPDGPFSRLRFVGDRVLTQEQNVTDTAFPPPDPSRPQCQVRVTFGEVLPSGTPFDAGNRVPDDEAIVYVGSMQGRGEECWTAVINSLNNVILSLAQTAAHEIGHLVGLQHVDQIDIMNRTATLAFQRELSLSRGQVVIETISGGDAITNVLTTIIQDPERYFLGNFARE